MLNRDNKYKLDGDFMEYGKYEEFILQEKNNKIGINIRKIHVSNKEIVISYIPEITDRKRLSDDIIKPLMQFCSEELNTELILSSVIYMDDIKTDNDENKIMDYILSGKSVIIIPDEERYIVANTYQVDKRSVESPAMQSSLRGAKDAFTENFDTNLSLIHYRLKDKALRVDNFVVGRRTKTSVAVLYIQDIANDKYVQDVEEGLNRVDVDGIVDSSYIEKFLKKKKYGIFPETGICERSDKACAEMLRGRICILVEGSNLLLVLPKTFIDFLDASDDHYENVYFSVFLKCLRCLALFITLTLSPFYIAVVGYHPDILPTEYILTLAEARVTVPSSAIVEILSMEIIAEILKEASLRLPKQIGSAIGIVGTIVIGQAAVVAGIVSPLTVIIISLTTMTDFVIPDQVLEKPIIILKFFLIITTALMGLFGYIMGLIFIVILICDNSSLGVPFSAPVAPFDGKDLKEYMLSDISIAKDRPDYLNPKDKTRQKG